MLLLKYKKLLFWRSLISYLLDCTGDALLFAQTSPLLKHSPLRSRSPSECNEAFMYIIKDNSIASEIEFQAYLN